MDDDDVHRDGVSGIEQKGKVMSSRPEWLGIKVCWPQAREIPSLEKEGWTTTDVTASGWFQVRNPAQHLVNLCLYVFRDGIYISDLFKRAA